MAIQTKYVPVLKWKSAEMLALMHIPNKHKDLIVPLIEIVLPSVNAYKDKERKKRKTDEEIHVEMVEKIINKRFLEIPEEIENFWGNHELYVDVTLLHNKEKTNELKVATLNAIINGVKLRKVKIIPVINLVDDSLIISNIRSLVSKKEISELCLRITSSNLKDVEVLDSKITSLLNYLGIEKQKTHIFIDLKFIDATSNYGALFSQAQSIRDLTQFKEFVFSSGAFPVDMSKCPFEETTYLPRLDWTNWKSNVVEKEINRVPIYSDYSMRYPLYNDSLQFLEATSTLKYTVDSQWMIMKGKKRALEMYLVHANMLVQTPEFKQATYNQGSDFSFGDEYITKKAKHFHKYVLDKSIRGMGRTPDWITVGISHHTAVVMHQLSILHDETRLIPELLKK